jgi:hypothetical protein
MYELIAAWKYSLAFPVYIGYYYNSQRGKINMDKIIAYS